MERVIKAWSTSTSTEYWMESSRELLPVQCDKDVATKALLKVVRCNCIRWDVTLRCFCRKAGLVCSTGGESVKAFLLICMIT